MNPALLELVPDELETYDPFTIREALNNVAVFAGCLTYRNNAFSRCQTMIFPTIRLS